jgi:RIO-like serine/threonine protein kinase
MSKKTVGAFIHIAIPAGVDMQKAFEQFKKNTSDCDTHVEVLVEGFGQTKEFTILELLTKLGFNVPSPL